MWVGDDIPIEVQRNAIKKIGVTFVNQDTKLPIDLSGYSFSGKVKYAAGAVEILGSVIVNFVSAVNGSVNITFSGLQLNSLPGSMEVVELSYDILVNDGSGPQVIMRGPLILTPGVS